MEQTKQSIATNNYEHADQILKEGDDLKNAISAIRKHQMNHLQANDATSIKASMVYLNVLQETQELVSVWRHLLRASRFFQNDYVQQDVLQEIPTMETINNRMV